MPPSDLPRIRSLPCAESVIAVDPLPGGLSNRNYRLQTSRGTFVVRVSDPESSALAINRNVEMRNSLAAAAAGVGAPVVDFVPDAGLLVVGWIEARPFGPEDIADPANWPRIAEACRKLHGGPRFCNEFDMFDIQEGYLEICKSRGYRLPDGYLSYMAHVARMKAAMRSTREETVPCNNDLLPANFIDDGKKIHIIDYEYSGNNEASFEIGNIWSEANLSLEGLEGLVTCYWGTYRPDKVARARLWGLMSKFGWTLWAVIQANISNIDFNYWEWGMEKFDRAVEEFEGPEFEALIEAVSA